MPLLPTLGPQPKKSLLGPAALAVVLVAAIAFGVMWVRGSKAPPPAPPVAPPPAVAAPVAPAAPPQDNLAKAGLARLSIRVDGPLETAVVTAVGKPVGAALTQVLTRSLVWWVKVPGEILKGDTLEALYSERPGEEPLVHAIRFVSGKHGKTFAAYRFQAPGDTFARFYESSGQELEERLVDSPIEHYEQITSLLRDGRRHKGVDFKAPSGTPVVASFDGTVVRTTWGFRANGNCFEVAESGGKRRKAYYLHMSELPKDLKPGRKVKKGELLATSGNSGRSFAPHLHYQLMSASDQVIDPFDSHDTYRRKLDGAAKGALEAEVARLDALLAVPVAAPFP